MSVILVTAAILTVQSSSMLQSSYAQSCPEGSPVDASGNCPTDAPPAGDEQTAQAPPPAGDEQTAQAPPPAGDEQTAQAPPPAGDGEIAQAPPVTETPPPAAIPQPANNTGGMRADWANSILAVHNSERAAVGVPPLVWSDSLAASAQTWAEHLLTIHEWVHSGPGENIASFSWYWGPTSPNGGGTPYWVAEKRNWHGGVLTNENWYATGHYTQMVWRNTQEVGCGVANDGGSSILVCHYNPPGNEIGKAPY
jgi:uncharacterized protein YkwD